ncbi:MAG TPA: lasso peptide biosynthesis B2 protein [Vicinamibacterales bacterium]|nr:lasso peptide biosynthesis B2 protein [Vicinamibacterales bacterium]
MLALARRAGTLTVAEWAILAESVALAVGIELALRLMPFSRVLLYLEGLRSRSEGSRGAGSRGSRRAGSGGSLDPPVSDGSSTTPELYRQLTRFTAVAYRLLPVPSTCLRESLVLCALLNRRGARARLCLGVDKNGAALAAHAWVECDGVASEGARSSFRELRMLPD